MKPEKDKIPKRSLLFQAFIFRLHISFSRGVDNGPPEETISETHPVMAYTSLRNHGYIGSNKIFMDFLGSPKLRLWMSFRMWISNSQERCWLQPPPGSLQRRAPVVLDPPSLRGSNQLGNGPTCHETPGNSQ